MNRQLLLIVLASAVAGCGGGGGGGVTTASDDDPAPLVVPKFYVGQAKFTRTTVNKGTTDALAFVGNVTWVTDQLGPAPRDYRIQSGTMSLAHEANLGNKCTLKGSKTFELEPGDGVLVMFQESVYSGTITKEVEFKSQVSCPGTSIPFPDKGRIDLEIKGSLINGVMEGTMPPVTATASTFKGSWKFMPN